MKKLLLVMLAILVLVVVGCGKDQPKSERASKGEIVISLGEYFMKGGYDPTQGWGTWAADPFHSSLYKMGEKNEPVMDLATDTKVSDDGLVYTIAIKKDVKFSNGKPLTANDVVFTYETAKAAAGTVDLSYLESVKALDAQTVQFTLSKPWSIFLASAGTMGIVPQDGYNKDTYGSAPVGSGPWKLVSFQKEQQLVMEPNEHYYGEKPKLKKVTVLNIGEDAAVAAAKSGQVDLIYINSDYANAKVDNMKLIAADSIESFVMNLPMEAPKEENGKPVGNAVTSDIAIRKALSIGINREEIIKNALQGYAKPAYNFASVLPWVQGPENKKDNRVEEAKKILEEAGWKDADGDGIREKNGQKAEFTITGRANDLQRYNTAVALAADAKKLGINITAQSMAWSDARKAIRHTPTILAFGIPSPQVYYSYYQSGQIGKNVTNNSAGLNDPTVDMHIQAALEAKSLEEAYKHFKMAQGDETSGSNSLYPYLWIADVQIPYLVNEQLELGKVGVYQRGQGMGIIADMAKWSWK